MDHFLDWKETQQLVPILRYRTIRRANRWRRMQNMRRVVLVFILPLLLQLEAYGAQVTVTTWNLKWFPSGTPNLAPLEVEARKIQDAASVLKKIKPDVILLQEIRDLETCEKLATALAPDVYSVAVCSRFKDEFGGGLGRQQVAILAKAPAVSAWSSKWKSFGKVDPPRGYAFASFRFGTNSVGFYSLHLKSNLTRNDPQRENQINILKRELAAEQIIAHAKEVKTTLTNRFEIVVVGGDFNTNPDQNLFVSEATLRLLRNDGFHNGFENVSFLNRITHPGKGRYPDATFDYLFIKGARAGIPEIISSEVSDHHPVTRTISLP